MHNIKRRRALPEGRIDQRDHQIITGISRATFYRKYRLDPFYIEAWDIRPYLGKLTMDEKKVRGWVRRQLGPLAQGYLSTFPPIPCAVCGFDNPPHRLTCARCGLDLPEPSDE